MAKPLVGIVMGSDSDLPIMEEAAKIFKKFDVCFDLVVASAHRTPYRALGYAEKAEEKGIEVIIAGAGAAAHLPGVLAAVTSLPVIGVPINATPLQGVDSLYAIVQMPSGIPVATVGINAAKNSALLAVQILAVKYPELRKKFKEYKQELAKEVEAKAEKVNRSIF